MFGMDLLIWLVVVAIITLVWHFAVPEREEMKLRRERPFDLTHVMHLKNRSRKLD